jgi:hypothetical protein
MPTMTSITIPFEGKTYRRLNGRWLDARLFVAVAERLSSLLDAEAHRLGVWDSVIKFDQRDRPGRLSPSATSPASSKKISHEFIGDGRIVHITADVAGDWGLLRKVHGFVGDCVLDEKYQFPLKVQLKIFHRYGATHAPVGSHQGTLTSSGLTIFEDESGNEIAITDEELDDLGYERYPRDKPDSTLAIRVPAIRYDFKNGHLSVWVELFNAKGQLNPALELYRQDGKQRSTVQRIALFQETDARYELQILVVAKEPPRPPIPDEREPLQKGFLHGGRPGSNRRH